MNPKLKGQLRVDGIALGLTRSEVDALLGQGTTNANLAWARYYLEDPPWKLGSPLALPVLVSFRPAWPQRAASDWRVQYICGARLSQGESVLLTVGDSEADARLTFGEPVEEFPAEQGFRCLAWAGILLTIDSYSAKIVEIALRFPSRLAKLSGHPPAETLLDGALAC